MVKFLNYEEKENLFSGSSIETVPILYRGPFVPDDLPKFRDGKSSIDQKTVREGVVIRVLNERYSPEIQGRLILKAVSPDYLTRKGNVTEFN